MKRDYADLRKRILRAYRYVLGHDDGAEDCAQDVIERILAGRHEKATLRQAVVDYLRREGGRAPETRVRRKVVGRPLNIDDYEIGTSPNETVRVSLIDIEESLKKLIKEDRASFLLNVGWGMDYPEIAYLFGVTPTVIFQRVTRAKQILRWGKNGEVQEHEG